MKKISLVFILSLLVNVSSFAADKPLKIGVMNLQFAINESGEGKKIKEIIERQVQQIKDELQKKRQEIESIYNELQTSVILSEDAKKQKQARAQNLIKELQSEQANQEGRFQELQRKNTEKLIEEISKIAKEHAKKEKFDFVLEAQVASGILYMKTDVIDITENVVRIYDNSKLK